jgi:hypothetical protein
VAARQDEIARCSVCGQTPVGEEFPRLVCRRCDAMAFNDAARPAAAREDGAGGDNPVYVEGRQCWRLYDLGGWVTILDIDNCRDVYDFCRRNKLPPPEE